MSYLDYLVQICFFVRQETKVQKQVDHRPKVGRSQAKQVDHKPK